MANHGYITTHHELTGDKLFDALTEISKARFGGLVKVEKGWDGWGPRSPDLP
jgi:hypothetical protein